ncbi:MAG TPA: hypothetical protein VGC03_07330 [Acidimicrobiia bacterium]
MATLRLVPDGGMMSSFNARLRLPGRTKLPLGVEVDIRHERMILTAGDRTVATWPLEEIVITSRSDGFHIKVDGDEVILYVSDSTRFASELGIGRQPARRLAVVGADQPRHIDLSAKDESRNGSPQVNEEIFAPRPAAETTPIRDSIEDMQRRIADIAKALTSDAVSPADAFGQWLALLKEINRRHGQGSMPSPQYYLLNTQLLDLIPEPAPAPQQPAI